MVRGPVPGRTLKHSRANFSGECPVSAARAAARAVFYSTTRPSTLLSTRLRLNTGSTLIQAVANDEEGGGGLVGQRTWSPEAATFRSISFKAGMLQMESLSPKFA